MSVFVILSLVLIQIKNINGLDAVCVPGVSMYASSKGPGFYYECQPGDDAPELKECPDGARWDRKTTLCGQAQNLPLVRQAQGGNSNSNEEDQSEIFFEPVLGRTVRLGDLYDARRDLPLNGFSLWNEDVIDDKKLKKGKLYSNTKFFFEKSQNDRLAKFSIDASLKLSFLGGLIEVGGSAHYLKDQKETSNHMRFNMMYEATTRTETLPMSLRQNLTYPDICSDKGPTHVISSVEYGMKAVFVFEKYVQRDESVEEIGGSLQVVVKSIPSFSIEGSAEINVAGSIKKVKESMDVRMFGDFIVEQSPTTYNDSAEVYKNLPKYLGDEANGYDQSSPVKIMLTPIGKYCTESHDLITGISAELLTKATEVMSDLGKVMLNVRTLESTYLAHKFLDVSALLKLFRIQLDVYSIEVKTKLRDIIPAMRGGGGEEQLPVLLKNYTNSPFQYDHGIRFLQERERELNTINSLFDDDSINKGDIKIGDFTSANIAHALLHKTYVFIYRFSVFSNIEVTEEYLYNRTITTDTWYNDYKSIGLAGYNWREFKTFVKINKDNSRDQQFFIQGSPRGDKLTQIFVYENGIELTSDFTVPMTPPKPKVIAKTYNSVTLLIGNDDDIIKTEFVSEILVKYGTQMDSEADYRNVIIQTNVNQLWKKGKFIDCYNSCGGKGGQCENICGEGGYCCRRGFHDCPDMAQRISPEFHSCVINSANKSGEILVTIEIPLEKEDNNGNTTETIPITHTFITAFQTPFGRGRDSEPLKDVRPLASSPPQLESVEYIDSTSVKLKWQKPDIISGHLILSGYKISIIYKTVYNTTNHEIIITSLKPATKYTIFLGVWFSNWAVLGETSKLDFYTIPSRPEKPSAVKIDKHDVTLNLDSRDELKIAPGATFKRYSVRFYNVDKNLTKLVITQQELDFHDNTVEISSLMQGTIYKFEYKVVTSKGSSLYSPSLVVETHYNKTELDKINEEISNRIDQINLAPIGTIVAWVNTLIKDHSYYGSSEIKIEKINLPYGWQRCNGSLIPETSILAGEYTPNLNGEYRFLKGGPDFKVLYKEESSTKYKYSHEGYGICKKYQYCDFHYSLSAESQPKSMYVIYIMKVL